MTTLHVSIGWWDLHGGRRWRMVRTPLQVSLMLRVWGRRTLVLTLAPRP